MYSWWRKGYIHRATHFTGTNSNYSNVISLNVNVMQNEKFSGGNNMLKL